MAGLLLRTARLSQETLGEVESLGQLGHLGSEGRELLEHLGRQCV
jgi:hypothetical protein